MKDKDIQRTQKELNRREFCKSTATVGAVIAAGTIAGVLNQRGGVDADDIDRKPKVNKSKCCGCGKCVRLAPKTFAINEQTRKAYVKNATGDTAAVIKKAVRSCPVDAITYE